MKETYPPGTIIEGDVKSVTEFGIFVGVEEDIDGLVQSRAVLVKVFLLNTF